MIPERYAPMTYALFRIVFGYVFMIFGLQKIFGWFGAQSAVQLMSQQGAAGIIEAVGGLLIMLGLFTPVAAFIASGEMASAYFIAHAHPVLSWPLMNKGELSVLYCFLFLYIAARGTGPYSLDRGFRRRVP